MSHVEGRLNDPNQNGVFGGNDSTASAPAGQPVGNGVFGFSNVPNASGVFGANNNGGIGVAGNSDNNFGVRGDSTNGFAAVHGHGGKNGMWGFTTSATDSGVFGQNDGSGNGVAGFSKDGIAVRGDSTNGFAAVHGHGGKNGMWGFTTSATDSGVFGQNDGSGDGVRAVSASGNGLSAFGGGDNGVAIFAQASAKRIPAAGKNSTAGFFDGNVVVAGDIEITGNGDIRLADLAEDFDISGTEELEPGSVVVLDDQGSLQQNRAAYDHKVAGVVAGAGNFRSAITLDRHESQGTRVALALMGKVYCKVDAQYSAIGVGDLLTTSDTPGYAMKATDPLKAFGAVIGKALRPLKEGQGLIPILIALQ